jgi:hypothetical protein
MAKQFSYQLREDLSVSQIVSFVTKLEDNHLLINKGFLKLGEYPTINQLNFEVTYDKSKENIEGNVPPYVLLNILYKLNSLIVAHTKKKGCPFILPTDKNSKIYRIFYFQDEYRDANNTTKETFQKDIIDVFYAVVTGTISGKEDEAEGLKKPDPISKLSYNLRQGDPIEAWTREKGAKQFANLLLTLPANELLVPGDEFGPEYQGESYAFEHAFEALNEFYKKFKEFIKTHDNYGHPDGSEEKKALNRLEAKQDPYFSGRSVLELVTINNEQLTGKLSTDDPKIREYIEIIDAAVKALKKDVPPPPSSGGGDGADGGETSEEEKKKEKQDKNKIIDFEQLYFLVKNRLVSYILETHYQDLINSIEDKDKYKVRKILLRIISDKIDGKLNLKVEIRSKLVTAWSDQIDGGDIYNDEKLTELIEALVVDLTTSLEVENEINNNLEVAKLEAEGFKSEEEKTQVKGVSANTPTVIIAALIKKGEFKEDFSEADWDKLTLSERVTKWKALTLQERYQFLVDNEFIDEVGVYAQRIAEDIIDDQLAQRNITATDQLRIDSILKEMQQKIASDLMDIPPSEFGDDPELFIQTQRASADFLRLEYSWQVEFIPSLDREIDDYVLHHPNDRTEQLSDILRGITSIEEAAKLVNPNLSSNEEISQRFEYASQEVFRLIDVNMGKDFGLPIDDIGQSLNDIRPFLAEFLLSEYGQEGLYILYNETQLRLFISKYGDKFIDRYGRYFMPLIEERYYEAHRQQVLVEMAQLSGGGSLYARQVDEAFHFILTEAVQSQIDPENYINSLSDEKLLTLFNAPKGFDQAQTDKFRGLVKEYLEVLRDLYNLDELIDDSGEYDEEDFDDGITFYQQQSRRNASPVDSGRGTFQAVTATGLTPDEMAQMEEAEYQDQARRDAQNKRALALYIWQAYTEEERAFLEQQNAQQMAAYEWEKMLSDQRSAKQIASGQKKPESKTRKLFKKGVDKAIVGGSTAALGLIPGVGTAAAGLIKVLPIPEKYKKYVAVGALGTAIGWLATVYSSVGGMIGGAIGGIVGFFIGGVGVVPGILIGGHIGFGLQKLAEGAWSNVTGFFKNIGDAIGNGLNSIGDTLGINTSSGVGRALPGGAEFSTGAGTGSTGAVSATQAIIGTTAGQAFVATVGTGVVGGILMTSNIHTAFLMKVPEVNPEFAGSSKYAIVEKTAIEGNEFDDPTEITYQLSITAREGYEILISAPPNDEFTFNCNEETRSDDCPDNTNTPEFSNYRDFVSRLIEIEGTVLAPGETLDVGRYTVPFNENYDDASIKNTFTVNFQVNEAGILSGVESAQATEQICFGECPALKEGCWPTDGIVYQLPYNQFYSDGSLASHRIVDALDISNNNSPNVYSTTDGEACFFADGTGVSVGSSYPYGNHVLVKSGSFAIMYGHFATLEESSGTCVDVSAGTKLGVMGTTGNSSGIHLHWEMRILGNGYMDYTTAIPGQSAGMTGQTLLEQHSPADDKVQLYEDVETCYE